MLHRSTHAMPLSIPRAIILMGRTFASVQMDLRRMALFVKVNNFPGGVGVPGISLGEEVRPGPSTPDSV